MNPRVDVVVLTWNDGDLLRRAVESALASTGVDVRVIVVDNGSDPPAEVPPDPRVEVVRNETNLGVAPARNQGVSRATAELCCLLDSDARLWPDSLHRMAGAVLSSPDVALAAPVFTDQAPEASAGRAPGAARKLARGLNLTDTYAAVRRTTADSFWDVDFAIGACQLFRRAAFDDIGGLDTSYFYGPEDVDFCLRLKEAGWRVVQVRAAGCDHPPRRRHRHLWTAGGARHAWAISRYLLRHHRARQSA